MEIRLVRKKENIILTEEEIRHIINEWYINGMISEILYDEDGKELDEVLDVDYSIKVETIRDDEIN